MAAISMEEARTRVALSNPNLSSADVRREADRLIATLDAIEFEDAARAAFEAQVVEDERQQSVAAQLRDEAFTDAQAIVARSNPGWDAASVDMEAHRLAAENASAIAALDLRAAIEG